MHKLTSETLQAVPLRGQIPSRWGFLCSALKPGPAFWWEAAAPASGKTGLWRD